MNEFQEGVMKKIIVEQYNPEWKIEFEKAKTFYEELFIGIPCQIEHVGSTSVEGLWAKPVLDIDIVVKTKIESFWLIEKLATVGYEHIGDLGLEGREAFKYLENNLIIDWMKHHLYVCIEGTEHLENHLLLRKHLRENRESVKLYSELKRKLAQEFSEDIDSYIDGKTDLITSFLKIEGMKESELKTIEEINKKSNNQ